MSRKWMIYGAYGYTGELTAREACRRGLKPVLAGRNEARTAALANELGLEHRSFDLSNAAAVAKGLEDIHVVLHCAGPFSATSKPMVDACLQTHTHYLDITGEIDVFAACHLRDDEARKANIVVLPGAGFDVVPTDCLAAMLAQSLPGANDLELAFEAGGGPSPGTAKTSVEGLGKGGRIRRHGMMTKVPLAYATRNIPFADGVRHGMTIPWGDVYTAHISTDIPNIKVFLSVPPATSKRMKRIRWLQPILGWQSVQNIMKKRIEQKVSGPDDSRREMTNSRIWGQVTTKDGQQHTAELQTPNGYDVTVYASLGIVEHLLETEPVGGYYTPSRLMGADYVLQLPGVEWRKKPESFANAD